MGYIRFDSSLPVWVMVAVCIKHGSVRVARLKWWSGDGGMVAGVSDVEKRENLGLSDDSGSVSQSVTFPGKMSNKQTKTNIYSA